MLSFLYVYSDHSILECYNLFSGVELSMRSFFVIVESQHDVICGTGNAFPMMKLSKSISHEHGNKIAQRELFFDTGTMVKRFISSSIGKIHRLR